MYILAQVVVVILTGRVGAVAGGVEVEVNGLVLGLVAVATELAAAAIVTVNNYYVCDGYGAATITPTIAPIITVTDNCFEKKEREGKYGFEFEFGAAAPIVTTGIGYNNDIIGYDIEAPNGVFFTNNINDIEGLIEAPRGAFDITNIGIDIIDIIVERDERDERTKQIEYRPYNQIGFLNSDMKEDHNGRHRQVG